MKLFFFLLIYIFQAHSQTYYIKVINETEWEYKQKSIKENKFCYYLKLFCN